MLNHPYQIHANDREQIARGLGLTLEEFDQYLSSANQAYEVFYNLGPFYGREDIKEPTFRITAEPVAMPKGSKDRLEKFGSDLIYLGKALKNLPEEYKKQLGTGLNFDVPPAFRIDAIIYNGKLMVNEVEGRDGASALMMVEQFAYKLQNFSQSTASEFAKFIKSVCIPSEKGIIKLALIRKIDMPVDHYTPNANRFIEFVDKASKGEIKIDHLSEDELKSGALKPDWSKYQGVLNEGSLSPRQLANLGIEKSQVLVAGNYNALVNKGVFALVFDKELDNFWKEQLGEERLSRLRDILIPTSFIKNVEDLEKARKENKVVKVSWAGSNIALVNRSQGVALPGGTVKQATDERWDMLKEIVEHGSIKVIAQDFLVPDLIEAFLRKRGTSLEKVSWYHRICVKFVAAGNPNVQQLPEVSLTATEVTLGPDIVPAGRACAFTAGVPQ